MQEKGQLSPVESYSGLNLHQVDCDVHGFPFAYSSCLRFIAANEDRIPVDPAVRGKCQSAIACRACPALAMRDEERTAGRAIYVDLYTPRQHSEDDFRRRSGEAIRGSVVEYADRYQAAWDRTSVALTGIRQRRRKESVVAVSRPLVAAKSESFIDEDAEIMNAVTRISQRLREAESI